MSIYRKNKYQTDILKLLSGASIAQLISVISTPLLSRLYSDFDFGIQGVIFSIYSFICFFGTFRLENTLIIDKEFSQKKIIGLLTRFLLISASIIFFLVMIFQKKWAIVFSLDNTNIYFLYFVPLLLILNQIYEILLISLNINSRYKELVTNKISFALLNNFGQICFGVFGANPIGLIIPQLISKLFLILKSKILKGISISKPQMQSLFLNRYKDYIRYETPSAVINSFNLQGPTIIVSSLYSISLGGQYFMTQRLLQLPISLLSHAVLETFRQKISQSRSIKESRLIFINTISIIFKLVIVPFLFVTFFSEQLIFFFLGEGWEEVSKIILYLLPSLFLRFFSYPLSFVLLLKEKQKINLLSNLIVGSLLVVFFMFKPSFEMMLLLISTVQCFKSLMVIFLSYIYLKD